MERFWAIIQVLVGQGVAIETNTCFVVRQLGLVVRVICGSILVAMVIRGSIMLTRLVAMVYSRIAMEAKVVRYMVVMVTSVRCH